MDSDISSHTGKACSIFINTNMGSFNIYYAQDLDYQIKV